MVAELCVRLRSVTDSVPLETCHGNRVQGPFVLVYLLLLS